MKNIRFEKVGLSMVSDEIKRLRVRLGISQKELGESMEVGQSTVAMWENGKNSPGYRTLLRLADFFGVGMAELTGENRGTVRVPVLGRVQAGVPCSAIEDIIGYEDVSESVSDESEFFALKIRGRSMEPRFLEGDTVIVRRQSNVDNGTIAIVLVGDEDATCKKFYRHKEGISLVSINPEFEPMFFSKEDLRKTRIEVIGRVCELRARF